MTVRAALALSDLLHYHLVDPGGRRLRLVDFALDLSTGAEAAVTHILFRAHGQPSTAPLLVLPWAGIKSVDQRARTMQLKGHPDEEPVETEWLHRAILLRRDLLDALMVDVRLRMPIIANDIWLEERKNQLHVTAVDIGFLAVLRRLSGGRLHAVREADLREWQSVEFLRGDPAAVRDGLGYRGLVAHLSAGEIAALIDDLPYRYAAELLVLLPEPQAADTLEMMMPELQIQAFEELDQEKALHLLMLMRPDIIADLLSRLTPDQARSLLEHIPRRQAEQVLELLRYPDDTAGGLMTNDVFIFARDTHADQAMKAIAESLKSPAYNNLIQFIYVVDQLPTRHLRGALTLRDLLIAKPETGLEEIMNPYLHSISVMTPALAAARQVIESGLTALPVVGEDNRLLGAVTIDSALAIVKPAIGERETLRLFT